MPKVDQICDESTTSRLRENNKDLDAFPQSVCMTKTEGHSGKQECTRDTTLKQPPTCLSALLTDVVRTKGEDKKAKTAVVSRIRAIVTL